MLTLITGGARSGKSRFAQILCAGSDRVVYIATARAEDAEMEARIQAHRVSRPGHWTTVEEPLHVAGQITLHSNSMVLIDCLTLWLSNLFMAGEPRKVRQYADELVEAARHGQVIAVTNEVGQGIVPESALAREFRDAQGFLNQQIAAAADAVYLMVCGIPVPIKGTPRA